MLPRTSKLVLQIVLWSIFLLYAILRMLPRDYSVVTAAFVCAFLTLIQSVTIYIAVPGKSTKFAFIRGFAILLLAIELIAVFTTIQFFKGFAFNDVEIANWLRLGIGLPPMINFLVFVAFLNYAPDNQSISETSNP